jgi:hypothetical protein
MALPEPNRMTSPPVLPWSVTLLEHDVAGAGRNTKACHATADRAGSAPVDEGEPVLADPNGEAARSGLHGDRVPHRDLRALSRP